MNNQYLAVARPQAPPSATPSADGFFVALCNFGTFRISRWNHGPYSYMVSEDFSRGRIISLP
jgi:hypothetical protein